MLSNSIMLPLIVSIAYAVPQDACAAQQGTCGSPSVCNPVYARLQPGLCPGGADNVCCVPQTCYIPAGGDLGYKGACGPVSACSGQAAAGLCPGDSSIQCCSYATDATLIQPIQRETIPEGSSASIPEDSSASIPDSALQNACAAQQGTCGSPSACKSAYTTLQPGLCPGGADNVCCVPQTCYIPAGGGLGYKGACGPVSACSGRAAAGLCPGDSSIQCCSYASMPTPVQQPVQQDNAPFGRVITSCRSAGQFAITFDDGPSRGIPSVLQVLANHGVKATFFVNAQNMANLETSASDRNLLLQIYNAGHQVASHSFKHADLSRLSYGAVQADMERNDAAIRNVIGVSPTCMRFPYLATSQTALSYMSNAGYHVVGINIDTEDWRHSGSGNEIAQNMQMVRSAMSGASAQRDTFISLSHDFTGNVAGFTDTLIRQLKSQGYRIVTIAECIGAKPYR
jgi:peptidoglycan/xylan/chitin deacetylase (PgdA/CDA1 family)